MFINMWSGPRCCSTALMYSFGQRRDTVVHDEPLYAAWLTLTGAARPYRDQVAAARRGASLARSLASLPPHWPPFSPLLLRPLTAACLFPLRRPQLSRHPEHC